MRDCARSPPPRRKPRASVAQLGDITAGPDGNLWFTEKGGNRIGRITPTGQVTEFSAGITAGAELTAITTGPDGNLWFTEYAGNRIGRITPTGQVTEFSTGITAGSDPSGITAGPDGNLWFTEWNADQIGRITPSGQVTEFTLGGGLRWSPRITAGPDGNLWFTEWGANQIGRITPTGQVTEFSAGISASMHGDRLFYITAGPDGNVWFTEGSQVGRVTPTGEITEFSAGTTGAFAIASGPDGNLWFTDGGGIGRITPAGQVTEFSSGISLGASSGTITAGPDGNLWFTESVGNRIGRISLRPSADLTIGVGTHAIPPNTGFSVSGTLSDPNPVAGKTLLIDAIPASGPAQSLGHPVTGASGSYTLSVPGGLPYGHWTLRATFSDPAYLGSTATVPLDVGTGSATVMIDPHGRTLPVGSVFAVTGRIAVGAGNTPDGRRLHLTATSPRGAVLALGDVSSSSGGAFSLTVPRGLPSVGRWTITAALSDDAFLPAAGSVVFSIGITPAMRVASSVSTTTYGRSIRVTVITGAWASGKLIYLYRTPYGSTDRLLARVRVPRSGRFTVTTRPANRTVYFAKYLGDSIRLPGSSPGVAVGVKFAITYRPLNATSVSRGVAIFEYHASCASRGVGCPVFRINIAPRLRGVPIRMEAAVNYKGHWATAAPATVSTSAGGVLYVGFVYDASVVRYTFRLRATALGSFGLVSSARSPAVLFRITR